MSSSRCILIIDDDDSIREFMGMALSDEGYRILTAAHGAAALQLIAGSRPDLILLDMRMPVMDGWEFARRYRALPGPQAPIVVLTAGRSALEAAQEIGAADSLAKPFDIQELLAVIEHQIGRDGQGQA